MTPHGSGKEPGKEQFAALTVDHPHDWPMHKLNEIHMCKVDGCVQLAVCIVGEGDLGPGRRSLTNKEQTDATILMWEDTIMVQAMQMIHGKERGMARYLYLTGRGPAA